MDADLRRTLARPDLASLLPHPQCRSSAPCVLVVTTSLPRSIYTRLRPGPGPRTPLPHNADDPPDPAILQPHLDPPRVVPARQPLRDDPLLRNVRPLVLLERDAHARPGREEPVRDGTPACGLGGVVGDGGAAASGGRVGRGGRGRASRCGGRGREGRLEQGGGRPGCALLWVGQLRSGRRGKERVRTLRHQSAAASTSPPCSRKANAAFCLSMPSETRAARDGSGMTGGG